MRPRYTKRGPMVEALREPIEWKVHLARERPGGLFLVAFVVVLAALLGLLKGPAYALLGPALIVLWVLDFLLPVAYRLTEEGVEVRQLVPRSSLLWKKVKRCVKTKEGIFLSPFSKPCRLDAYRGVFLRNVPPKAEDLIRKKARDARWVEEDGRREANRDGA